MIVRSGQPFTLRDLFDRFSLISIQRRVDRYCPASSQSPAAYFCGARSLVLSVGPRRAQRSSSARPARTVPPLLPRLQEGYRA